MYPQIDIVCLNIKYKLAWHVVWTLSLIVVDSACTYSNNSFYIFRCSELHPGVLPCHIKVRGQVDTLPWRDFCQVQTPQFIFWVCLCWRSYQLVFLLRPNGLPWQHIRSFCSAGWDIKWCDNQCNNMRVNTITDLEQTLRSVVNWATEPLWLSYKVLEYPTISFTYCVNVQCTDRSLNAPIENL